MFHPDYIELGSSGHVYDRQMIVEMMSQENSAGVVIRDFSTATISEDTALATYRSIGQSGEEARRSSIWVKSGERWLIRFHQGTRIPNRWGRLS
jgi:ribonuclease HI